MRGRGRRVFPRRCSSRRALRPYRRRSGLGALSTVPARCTRAPGALAGARGPVRQAVRCRRPRRRDAHCRGGGGGVRPPRQLRVSSRSDAAAPARARDGRNGGEARARRLDALQCGVHGAAAGVWLAVRSRPGRWLGGRVGFPRRRHAAVDVRGGGRRAWPLPDRDPRAGRRRGHPPGLRRRGCVQCLAHARRWHDGCDRFELRGAGAHRPTDRDRG